MICGVTLIVTTFNHQSYIEQCLASIVDQTRLPERTIVIDDGSVDDTSFVIRSWLSANQQGFEFIDHAKNLGLTRTLNEALDMVQTDCYVHLSADDWLAPTRVADQYAALSSTESDIAAVVSDFIEVDEGGRTLAVHDVGERLLARTGFDAHSELFEALIERNFVPAVSVMMKTAAVRSVGGYDENLWFEDYDLWLRLSARYGFIHDPHIATYYRILNSGMTRSEDAKIRFLETEAKTVLKAVPHCKSTELAVVHIESIADQLLKSGASTEAERIRTELSAALATRSALSAH